MVESKMEPKWLERNMERLEPRMEPAWLESEGLELKWLRVLGSGL